MKHLAFVLAFTVAACSTVAAGPITAVTVRDGNFEVVKELSASEVETFDHLWNSKTRIEDQEQYAVRDKDHYKLDIGGGTSPGRWLYKTNGKTSKLDPLMKKVFTVQDVGAFNRLIGATK